MAPIKTVSWIGLGALGSVYLARMSENLPPESIRVIAGGDRGQRYRQDGVFVNGKQYFFPVYAPDEQPGPADLVIFAVKYNQLNKAINDVRHHVGPDTVILSLLNGITSEEIIGGVYGMDKLLYALSIGIDAVRTGRETRCRNIGYIPFGEPANPPGYYSDKVKRVREFFEQAKIPYDIPENMLHSLWRKYMINVGVNQITAMLRAPYGPIQKEGEARSLMLASMREVAAVSVKAGVPLSQKDIDDSLRILDGLSPEGKTSMLQDVEAGRDTEVEIFAGTLIALGKQYNVPVPVNEMLYRFIKATEDVFAYYRSYPKEYIGPVL